MRPSLTTKCFFGPYAGIIFIDKQPIFSLFTHFNPIFVHFNE